MAKLERKTQKIFGASAGNRSFTAFGTAKNDNPEYTQDLDQIQNNAYNYGWEAAVLADRAPYEEDTNALLYMLTYQIAYLMQQGAAVEYDPNTTYYMGSIVSSTDGTGTWYKSLADDNLGNPLSNPQYWQAIELAKNGMPLFTQITTDHVLTGDDGIGWAMQGTEVSNSIYPEAYAKILSLYNTASNVSYRGVSAKRTTDGRYIADISQQATINNLFNNSGVADFYIINPTAQSFWLPKTARFIQYTTDTNNINQFIDSGLPALNQTISGTTNSAGAHTHTRGTMDIVGTLNSGMQPRGGAASGAFSISSETQYVDRPSANWGNAGVQYKLTASKNWTGSTSSNGAHTHTISFTNKIGNAIYGASNIVQAPASLKLLYYRVGNTAV